MINVKDTTLVEEGASKCEDDALAQSVTVAQIETGADDEALYRHMLVEITEVTVDTVGSSYFTTEGSPMRVSEFLGGLDFAYSASDDLSSVRGVVDYFNGYSQLAPRSESDLVP